MVSFSAKISWIRLRKIENKNYHSVSFLLDASQKIKKKKFKKIKKIPLWLHFKPKQAGNGWEIEKIKILIPFRSDTMRKENSKKVAKKL